jgi:hypothetical protein
MSIPVKQIIKVYNKKNPAQCVRGVRILVSLLAFGGHIDLTGALDINKPVGLFGDLAVLVGPEGAHSSLGVGTVHANVRV